MIEDTVSARTGRDEERNTEDLGEELGDPREDDGESADGTSHDKGLELNLDGQSWTLAMDADGQGIHLELNDGQGGTARFGVEIGPNGLPQIAAGTAAGEGDSADADCAPASPTPESQVSGDTEAATDATSEEQPTPGRPAADAVPDHENTPALASAGDATADPQPQAVSVQQEPAPAATGIAVRARIGHRSRGRIRQRRRVGRGGATVSHRAAELRAQRAQMRADLDMFRERIDERRARDEEAAANRSGRSRTEPAAASPAAAPPETLDDDEFYRPRSWLV
ncbi:MULTISPECIES: hypothetical protein [Rhodococcus]|nr:hypothetical protein [Rhodococcus sp. DK17]